MNNEIINLLEQYQEYINLMSLLQSNLSDGYLEIAQAKKSSITLLPQTIHGIGINPRLFFNNNQEIPEKVNHITIPGVSNNSISLISNHFENTLKNIINIIKVLENINIQINKIKR